MAAMTSQLPRSRPFRRARLRTPQPSRLVRIVGLCSVEAHALATDARHVLSLTFQPRRLQRPFSEAVCLVQR